VARFLSAAWAEEFDAALAGFELPAPAADSGLAAADGRFTVAEEVHGTPDGDVRLLLVVADSKLGISVAPVPAPGAEGPEDHHPDVTLALSYQDAAALSAGELDPAEALRTGRIRVRGDLSVLVAAQQMLDAARGAIPEFTSATTY
jgi:hypothetical protein